MFGYVNVDGDIILGRAVGVVASINGSVDDDVVGALATVANIEFHDAFGDIRVGVVWIVFSGERGSVAHAAAIDVTACNRATFFDTVSSAVDVDGGFCRTTIGVGT